MDHEAKAFLQAVWEPLSSGSIVGIPYEAEWKNNPTVLSLWGHKDKEGYLSDSFFNTLTAINNKQYTLPDRGGIFWLPASRKQTAFEGRYASAVRGSREQLGEVACLWADFDTDKLGLDRNDVYDRLMSISHPPSIIYFTGGGIQSVHLLDSTVDVSDISLAKEFGAYNKGFYRKMLAERGLLGTDDKVYNADRMMRLPGFYNRKRVRNNALATMLYFAPHVRYSYAHIKEVVGPIETKQPFARPYEEKPTTAVFVFDAFTTQHLVFRVAPDRGGRHNALRRIIVGCAASGVPKDVAEIACQRMLDGWFNHSIDDTEYHNLLEWGYSRDEYSVTPVAPVKWDSEKQAFFLQEDLTIHLDSYDPNAESMDWARVVKVDPEQRPLALPLNELRAEQHEVLEDFVYSPISNVPEALILQTPPGVGKTYELVRTAENFARKWLEENPDRRPDSVRFFQLFTQDEDRWEDWVRSNNGDPELWSYFVGRNNDPTSKGYCAYVDLANLVAERGYSVNQKLCAKCPLQAKCKEGWYLSQFDEKKRKPIMIYRHQHGKIEAFTQAAQLAIFDESIINSMLQPIEANLNDFKSQDLPPAIESLFPDEVEAARRIEAGFRMVLVKNMHSGVVSGGRVLFDGLVQVLPDGMKDIEWFLNAPDDFIEALQDGYLDELTASSVASMPLKFVLKLKNILKYEYDFYTKGYHSWNSRLAIKGQSLLIFPMEPFKFSRNAKIVVADATADPIMYNAVFSGNQDQPVIPYVYKRDLPDRGTTIQFIGSEYSRSSLRSTDPQTVEMALKERIRLLSERHPFDILVITYKNLVPLIQQWIINGELKVSPDHVLYFGSLRGTNNYQHVKAAAIIGRQRLPDDVLVAQTLALHWRDEPIIMGRRERVEPYPYYTISGEGRGYKYTGWSDPNLNAVYLNTIQSETIQAAQRIRVNSSVDGDSKTIYLMSAFPTLPPHSLLSNTAFARDLIARDLFESVKNEGASIDRASFVSKMKDQGVSRSSAYRSWDTMMQVYAPYISNIEVSFKSDLVTEWLLANPDTKLSDRQIADMLGVNRSTVSRAKKNLYGN